MVGDADGTAISRCICIGEVVFLNESSRYGNIFRSHSEGGVC